MSEDLAVTDQPLKKEAEKDVEKEKEVDKEAAEEGDTAVAAKV